MTSTWRLILDGPVDGVVNMTLDRAIQLSVDAGDSPPTLRLYRWSRPTVTMGRFQDLATVDLDVAHDAGVDVVRRFTGGRGVLHDNELTYSVIARVDDGVPRGVAASYRHLSAPLAEAYRLLGVEAEITERDRSSSKSGACYLATTRADLSLGALKLSGSAQVWAGATVLQHGSFTVSRDVALEARLFKLAQADADKLARSVATIVDATGTTPSFDLIAEKIVSAFSDVLGIRFEIGSASATEVDLARTLEPQVKP